MCQLHIALAQRTCCLSLLSRYFLLQLHHCCSSLHLSNFISFSNLTCKPNLPTTLSSALLQIYFPQYILLHLVTALSKLPYNHLPLISILYHAATSTSTFRAGLLLRYDSITLTAVISLPLCPLPTWLNRTLRHDQGSCVMQGDNWGEKKTEKKTQGK